MSGTGMGSASEDSSVGEFDQTNGVVDGLEGDDGGALEGTDGDLMAEGAGDDADATPGMTALRGGLEFDGMDEDDEGGADAPEDDDAVTSYSEEGRQA